MPISRTLTCVISELLGRQKRARLLMRAGLNKKSNRWYVLHVHSLRKYFRSHCIGVDASYRAHWMGHRSGYLDESYLRAEEQEHLAQYGLEIPHLTVYTTPKDEKSPRNEITIGFVRPQGNADRGMAEAGRDIGQGSRR